MAETEKRSQTRDVATLDKNRKPAEYLVSNCAGMSQRQAAEALAGKFPGDGAASTFQSSISNRAISKLVRKNTVTGEWEWIGDA